MRKFLLAAAIALGAASAVPAQASQAVPESLGQRLDTLPVEYSMTAAKQRRLMMMQEAARQQRRQQYGHRGPAPGYGPGVVRRHQPYGYGPQPGYRRPPPPPPRW